MVTETKMLTTHEVADYFGVNYRTVMRWRRSKKGPAFVKIVGSIRYPKEEVERFLREGETS